MCVKKLSLQGNKGPFPKFDTPYFYLFKTVPCPITS